MLGPYRVPGPVEPDLPARCSAERCSAFVPHPPRFPASILCAPPPRPAPPSVFAKALSTAATALLLVASASLSAVTYSVVERQARTVRDSMPVQAVQLTPLPAPPRAASPPHRSARAPVDPGPAVTLSMMSEPTHDVGELWYRARALQAAGADVSLSHRPLSTLHYSPYDVGALRVVPEQHKGYSGLRVLDLSDGFASAAGVIPGDLVLAVNGYPAGTQAEVARAFAAAQQEDAAVVEIWRNGRRFVLFIDREPKMR